MSPVIPRLGGAAGERYVLEREVGRGGMAVVYVARDLRHRRHVALKILLPELSQAVGAERFLREIEIAAGLNHPHILPLLDSGDAEGLLFYVMPYVEGESLRDRLSREKQLPWEEAVQIAREIAAGLSHAHSHGIIHRDIKPENILLSGGEAVVADFGIARAIDVAGERLTVTGLAIGTPDYMSPEQAVGNQDLDARTDIYALGCVLYEMLAGEPPYSGPTPQAVMAKRLSDPVPRITARRATVPLRVEAVIGRALSKAAADRFTTAHEFAEALREAAVSEPRLGDGRHRVRRRVVLAAIGLIVAALVLVTSTYALIPAGRRATLVTLLTRPDPKLYPRRIVVAPLDNRAGDTSLSVLGEMAADWIAQELLRTGAFEVVDGRTALTTAQIVAQIPRPLRHGDLGIAVAEETGAGVVISGDIYRVGDSLHARLRVVDAAQRKLLRTPDPVTTHVSAPVELVAALGRRVVAALATAGDTTLMGGDVGAPPSYAAYQETSLAWESWFREEYDVFLARARRAHSMDSAYMPPLLMQLYHLIDRNRWAEAEPLLRRVERDRDRLTTGEQLALEIFRADLRGDLPQRLRAAQDFQRQFATQAEVPLLVAQAAVRANHPHAALDALARTSADRGLNLVSPLYWWWWCHALHALGQHERELTVGQQGRRRFPTFERTRGNLLRALAALGRLEQLERALRDARPPVPRMREELETRRYTADWGYVLALRELRAHGHERAASALLAGLEPVLDRAVDDSAPRMERAVHGMLLYEGARWTAARSVFQRLVREDSTDATSWGYLGTIAARLGERDLAETIGARLGRMRDPYAFGSGTFARARIAAVLGDHAVAVRLLQVAFAEGYPFDGAEKDTPHDHGDFAALRAFAPFQKFVAPRD